MVSWDATSVYNGPGTTVLRVLEPDDPSPGQAHRLVYVLPVKPIGADEFTFGDGLEQIRLGNFHNLHNLTLIAPSFHVEPYIGDHPTNNNRRAESYICVDLYNWVEANLVQPETEARWLVSFSKGGVSTFILLMRHPTLFDFAVVWDADASKTRIATDLALNDLDWDDVPYGTEANFDANYDPIELLPTWAPNFDTYPSRVWLAGDTTTFGAEMIALHNACVTEGLIHYWQTGINFSHHWNSGWIPTGIEAGYQHGVARGPKPLSGTSLSLTHPLNANLQVALLFNEGSGTTVSNAGPAAIGPATLQTGQSWAIHPTTGNPVLHQVGSLGLDFGTTFTALDLVPKTVVIWCAPDNTGGYQGLVDQDFGTITPGDYGGWSLLLSAARQLTWYVDNVSVLTDPGALTAPVNYWRMLAATWNPTTQDVRFYVDGQPSGVLLSTGKVEQDTESANLLVGAVRNNTANIFRGDIEQVRLYTRVLSDTEMAQLFANPYTPAVATKTKVLVRR